MIINELKNIADYITPSKTIHFVGIGGVGMSAIARILLEQNYKVTGSDLKESINTIRLKDFGAKIFYKHDPSNLRVANMVVVSSAIREDNPEYVEAINNHIPVFKRGQMLSFIMEQFSKKIAIAGTHGKTTTSSMITMVLDSAKKSPTYTIGADMNDFQGNAALGNGNFFVTEADESDGSFLYLNPNISVVTNVESEHMEYFKSEEQLKKCFHEFIGKSQMRGYSVLNGDDLNIQEIIKDLPKNNLIFFGLNKTANFSASDIVFNENGVKYTLLIDQKPVHEICLQVYGLHNVHNSLAAIAIGVKEGIPLIHIAKALADFSGTKRRFQLVGQVNDIMIFDDYAHHPTEIKATLESIKASFNRRIVCIFQPHRYSRTYDLLTDFTLAFDAAELVVITEIYSAHEQNPHNISAKMIKDKMVKQDNTFFIAHKGKIIDNLLKHLKPNDLVITMGAGDIYTVAKELCKYLKQKKEV
ncbi:MAG: UDP-N-acetylmuramate--L-alanine ligase [Candidatus Margulisiibacteriota bacterium]|jgi:UDP-N-acetylmuramate--alanine ligase